MIYAALVLVYVLYVVPQHLTLKLTSLCIIGPWILLSLHLMRFGSFSAVMILVAGPVMISWLR